MNMIKLKHKPSGRYLTISEAHALSLMKGDKSYIEVPIEEGIPVVKKIEEIKEEPEPIAESEIEAPVKKISKKKSSKKS